MSFYIGKIKLPILEAGVRISRERESTNVPILNGETITIMGKKGLTQIEYSSMFPKQWGNYCDVTESQLKAPNKYKKLIEEMRDSENYFLVRITELKYNQYCKIKSAEFSIENGVGDIGYTISLEEYNKLNVSKTVYTPPTENDVIIATEPISMTNTALTGPPRESKTIKAHYHYVDSKETIFSISKKYNMSAAQLYADNISIIGNDWVVKEGMKLFIRGTDTEQNKKIDQNKKTLTVRGRTVVVNHS